MKLDPKGSYFMPVSVPQRPLKVGVFEDVWMLSTSYRTDTDVLAALLPFLSNRLMSPSSPCIMRSASR